MLRGTRPLQNLQPVSDCTRPSVLPFRRSHRFSLLPVALTPLEAKPSSLSTNAVTAALKYEAGIERTWPVLALLDPLGRWIEAKLRQATNDKSALLHDLRQSSVAAVMGAQGC